MIPSFLWPGRMIFQFWYALSIVGGQTLWGILIHGKIKSVCPMTTVMQLLRGYGLNDEKNYNHGFIAEFIRDIGIPLTKKGTSNLLHLSFVLIVLQYLFLV